MVQWKCIIWAKSDLPISNSVCEKVWFKINGSSKMLFFNFYLFYYCQKSYNETAYNETAALLSLFEICTEMHFVSLFFPKERNITTSLLMIHLKCAVVHYANLNSSSRNKWFLNYGLLNILFRFFRFLICVYFNEAFVKKFIFIKIYKIYINNYHFLIQISKIHFKI